VGRVYPNDNNIVEIQNGHDKLFRRHNRSKYIMFLDEFPFYLEDVSSMRVGFYGQNEIRCAHTTVHDIVCAYANNQPSILSFFFPSSFLFLRHARGSIWGYCCYYGERSYRHFTEGIPRLFANLKKSGAPLVLQ
jgi:hypothetical protein